MQSFRSVALFCAVLSLSACGARVFEAETKSFADATTGVEEVWSALYDRLDAVDQSALDRQRVREGWAFRTTRTCRNDLTDLAEPLDSGLSEADRKVEIARRKALVDACYLTERVVGADPSELRRVESARQNRKLLEIGGFLSAYAKALAELTAAQDEAALRTAATDMAASLNKASTKLARRADLDIDVSGPISALASVYAEARLASLERAKYQTLVEVVRRSDGAVQRLSKRLAEVEPGLRADLLDAQSNAVRLAVRDLRQLKASAPQVERARRQQAAIDRMAEYKAYAGSLVAGGVSYASVGAAHAALLQAIEKPNNFKLAKSAADRLKDLGEAVKEAAEAFGADI